MQSKQAASFIDLIRRLSLSGNSAIGQWHLIIAHLEPIHETVQIKAMEMAYEEACPEDVLRQEIRRQRWRGPVR